MSIVLKLDKMVQEKCLDSFLNFNNFLRIGIIHSLGEYYYISCGDFDSRIKPLESETKKENSSYTHIVYVSLDNTLAVKSCGGKLPKLIKSSGVILSFCSALLNMLAFLITGSTQGCKMVAIVPDITVEGKNMQRRRVTFSFSVFFIGKKDLLR